VLTTQFPKLLPAHKLVQATDRIIVLKQGRIIEEGHHDQLMTQVGHYAELYNTYFRHQSLEFIDTRPSLKFSFTPT
jgi:ATP-binding cassette subfamily B protein